MTAPRVSRGLWGIALAVLLAGASAGASHLLRAPRFVDRVAIVNPSPYGLEVQVSGAGRGGWMLMGYMAPARTTSVALVVDQGDTWVFRVRAQDVAAGAFAISRSQLEALDWKVTVPASVIARLAARGIPVPPASPGPAAGG